MTQDDRPFCEDCGIRSDLGNKCRPCYAKWSRRMWRDIPDRLAEVTHVAKELNKLPDEQRKAIAAVGIGKTPDVAITGHAAALVPVMKRALEGPYGEQLVAKLQAIHNAIGAAETKSAKRRYGEEAIE